MQNTTCMPAEQGRPVVVHVHQDAPDELVAFPFGLDARTARALVRSGELPSRKLGRRLYARRSDLLALVPPRRAGMARDLANGVRDLAADDPRTALVRKVGQR